MSNVIGLEIGEINLFSAGFPETIDVMETKMGEILPGYAGERSATVCHILCKYADLDPWYKFKVNLFPCFHCKITALDFDGATPPRRYSISAYATTWRLAQAFARAPPVAGRGPQGLPTTSGPAHRSKRARSSPACAGRGGRDTDDHGYR